MSRLAWTIVLLSGLAPGGDGLGRILSRPVLDGITVSIAVADAETGEMLFARSLDEPLAPASNMKLLTTSAALVRLGPEYHFRTTLLATEAPDARGVLAGDLVIVGGGDPCLRNDLLGPLGLPDPTDALAGFVADAGITRIDGALVLDDGFLDREWVHPDWNPADLDKSFAAPISALSLQGNCLSYAIDGRGNGAQPEVRLLTRASGYRVENRVAWGAGGQQPVAGATQPDDSGALTVNGRLARGKEFGPFDIPVRDGTLLFGRALRTALEARGIAVRGGLARDAGAGRSLGSVPELGALRTHISFATVVCNKESDNSLADHIFKVLGAEVAGDGSFAGGARVVLEFLGEDVGTPTDGFVIRDGSGLSRENRVSARALVALLVTMNRPDTPGRDVFLRSLPVSGLDGSLQDRLTETRYRGAVRAKTGYVLGTSSLTGYVHAASGRVLAFSILMSGSPMNNAEMKRVQDDVCRDLVDGW